MRRIPLFPCKTALENAAFPTPLGLTVPIPVITTRRFKPHPSTYQDFYQAELSGELPPRSAAHKFLLIQSKYHARPNRKHGLFHREGVLRQPGRAFDDHRLVCVLGANPAVLIFRQIPGLARLTAGAEDEGSIEPQAPYHHRVRRPVRLHRRDPIIVTLFESLLSPLPGKQSLLVLRQPVSRHEWSANLGFEP